MQGGLCSLVPGNNSVFRLRVDIQNLDQRNHDLCRLRKKTVVIIDHADETLKLDHRCGLRERADPFDLTNERSDALPGDSVPEKIDGAGAKLAFLRVHYQSVVPQPLEQGPDAVSCF